MSVQTISVEGAARHTFSTLLAITVAVALALLVTVAAARAGHGVLRTPSAPAPTVCQVARDGRPVLVISGRSPAIRRHFLACTTAGPHERYGSSGSRCPARRGVASSSVTTDPRRSQT